MNERPSTTQVVNEARQLMQDVGFEAITHQQYAYEVACCGLSPAFPFSRYLWEAAYSEVRAFYNPDMRRHEASIEAEWIDNHCFGW